jgi:hypothetical protein
MRRIGVLMPFAADDPVGQARIAAFREGLEKLGWTEGRNIRIDTRWTSTGDVESMQRFAKEFVALQPDLIVTQAHRSPRRCCKRHAPSPSFSRSLPIRSAAAAGAAGSRSMPKSRGRKPKKPRAPTKGAPEQLIAHNTPRREPPIPAQTVQQEPSIPPQTVQQESSIPRQTLLQSILKWTMKSVKRAWVHLVTQRGS